LKKLRRARDGDLEVRKELKDLVHGRSGRLKEVIDHVSVIRWALLLKSLKSTIAFFLW
jgi:hypothetical protein